MDEEHGNALCIFNLNSFFKVDYTIGQKTIWSLKNEIECTFYSDNEESWICNAILFNFELNWFQMDFLTFSLPWKRYEKFFFRHKTWKDEWMYSSLKIQNFIQKETHLSLLQTNLNPFNKRNRTINEIQFFGIVIGSLIGSMHFYNPGNDSPFCTKKNLL